MHADILKLATTKERRARIKWYHARQQFFHGVQVLSDTLPLVQECEHEDARFLASLFADGVPDTRREAVSVFLAQGDEPRCLCWAAVCAPPGEHADDLTRRAAEKGYAWAQYQHSYRVGDDNEDVAWKEKAVAQGEPGAMTRLAGREMENGVRAVQLYREAALLGDEEAQLTMGLSICPGQSTESFVWLRRAAMQENFFAVKNLVKSVVEQVRLFDNGSTGRNVFEIGAALSLIDSWTYELEYASQFNAGQRAISFYEQKCADAKKAVLCWLWLSRTLAVSKDIRLLIADLIWDERAAWSDVRGGTE